MPAMNRSLSVRDFLPDDIGLAVRRRIREIGGFLLIALTAVAVIALATWSVTDPSFSHATSAKVRNLLGTGGAVAADLLMQLFGLASLALLAPVAIWGWRLITHRPMHRERSRVLARCHAAAFHADFDFDKPAEFHAVILRDARGRVDLRG